MKAESMKKLTQRSLFLFVLIGILSACGSDSGAEKDEAEETELAAESTTKKAQKILYSLPSPIETASMIKKTGANYNKDILNPIENVSEYVTLISKALNMGVYGADLSYASVFDQTQESMFYLSCVKKLADGLGITNAFNENIVGRMQANMSNQDSILQIVSDSYMESDAYLKENERANTSALIIAGGWIEGLYIATKIANSSKKNDELIRRVAEQKSTLSNLISMLEGYEGDETLGIIVKDLKELYALYEGLSETKTEGETSTNAQGVTTIGGETNITMTQDQLNAITGKISAMRNSIIN